MTNISRTGARAFSVATVICIPLLAYQVAIEKSAIGTSIADTSRVTQSSQSAEPELGAAVDAQSWKILPNIKNGRFESTAIQYRDDLYAFNGFGLGIQIEQSVEKFDAGTQKWSVIGNTSATRGTGVTHNGFVVIGNEVWILGGRVGSHPGAVTSEVWKFNLNTYKWSKGPQLPAPVAAGGAALVDNRIHWFGGLDAYAQCDVDNHYVYDLDNPSAGWSDISGIAPMPTPRNHFATVVYKDLIYAIGGQFTHDGCGAGTPDTELVHVFNPKTNTWKQIASLPEVQSHNEPSTFVHKGAIYVVGGAINGNKVYRYDPSKDDWDTVAELPQPLLAPIANVVDNELIVSSGGSPGNIPSMATYSIDMTQLLLPGAEDTSNDDDLIQTAIVDSQAVTVTDTVTAITDAATTDTTSTDIASTDTPTDTSAVVAGDSGLVALEAEFYDTLTTTDTHQWVSMNDTSASNNAAMRATPDSNKIAKNSADSPSMAYFAYFDRPGTWYLWVRGWGDTVNGDGGSDSLHAGLNGSLSPTADKINTFPASWNWSSSTRDGARASLEIPSAGIHVVNLWMREDGLAVDKILLTTNANYEPTGEGAAASDKVSLSNDGAPSDADTDAGNSTNTAVAVDNETIVEVTSTTVVEGTPTVTVEDTAVDLVDDTKTDTTEALADDATEDGTKGGGSLGVSLLFMMMLALRRTISLKRAKPSLLQ